MAAAVVDVVVVFEVLQAPHTHTLTDTHTCHTYIIILTTLNKAEQIPKFDEAAAKKSTASQTKPALSQTKTTK